MRRVNSSTSATKLRSAAASGQVCLLGRLCASFGIKALAAIALTRVYRDASQVHFMEYFMSTPNRSA